MLLVGVALAIAGACLVGLGLHQYLSTVVGQAWASVIVGAILIAGAGGCVWTFNRLLRN
ncbi:MAG TPA: hypothetical protein VG797_04165 [Phycisphaerales bacterium]|nr:hypothetical protein [Phycisphaerales bacterium]